MLATDHSQIPLYRGFACPQEGFDCTFLEDITVRRSRKIVRSFLSRYRDYLDTQGQGLSWLLHDWLKQPAHYGVVWDLAFGELYESLLIGHEPQDVRRRAAALGLHLHEQGMCGEWSVQLEQPARLRWGSWLLPPTEHLHVRVQGGQAVLHLGCRGERRCMQLHAGEDGWQAPEAEPVPWFTFRGHKITLLLASALESGNFEEVRSLAIAQSSLAISRAYQAALTVLDQYAPVYVPWVLRAIQYLIPVQTSPDIMASGSDLFHNGTVYMSYQAPPIALAELMVHEASHQHCHMLCQLGRLDDGSDPTLYYSPVKKIGRPIGAILKTYHAFANILLFYRLCRAHGFAEPDYCLYNEADLLPQLEALDAALSRSSALTEIGKALWQPLRERLASRDVT